MKYRARANGNILDSVPESLIGVLYDAVDDEAPAEDAPAPQRAQPEPEPSEVTFTPEAEVLTTDSAPALRRRPGRGRR